METIDRVGPLGADRVAGTSKLSLYRNDPIWAAMAAELAATKALLADLKAKHNALLAKLDADAGVTDTDYAATQAVASPVPEL